LIDPYLKNIPDIDIPKKEKGLNICVFSDYNIAGNLTLITSLINKYTIHKARCIIVIGDYLDYAKDIVLIKDPNFPIEKETAIEASEIIRKADFFHIGRRVINFADIDFSKILNRHNCVFKYFGSYLRDNQELIRKFHEESGIHGVSGNDWTMKENSGFMHSHFTHIYDAKNVIPWYQQASDNLELDPIRIVHSPTNRGFKKTDLFLKIIEKLKKDFNIDLILLEGLSNSECMKRKSVAHVAFDQISVGAFGLTAVESMAAGQAVLCSISNFVESVFPDHPVIPVTENTLEAELRLLLSDKARILDVGIKGREWVLKHCDPIKAVKQWIYLYDLIMNGNRMIENDDFFINT